MENELIILSNPKSSVSENIRTIRTNLQFSSLDKETKTILVTSSISGEGKSFIAANLASAFAGTKKKVIILDCDLRKGRLHKIFGLKRGNGMSNLIIDKSNYISDYIEKTKVENLDIIQCGTIAPNPSELLGSKKFKSILHELENNYDYVIIDSVPTIGLPDALIMARLVDKVVIVASVDYTPFNLLEDTKKSLENVQASIAGVVVNRVKGKKSEYYSNYYSRYYEK